MTYDQLRELVQGADRVFVQYDRSFDDYVDRIGIGFVQANKESTLDLLSSCQAAGAPVPIAHDMGEPREVFLGGSIEHAIAFRNQRVTA